MGYLPLTEVAELTSINACLTGAIVDNMQKKKKKKPLHDLGAKFSMPPAGSVCPVVRWPMVLINPGV